MMIDIAKVALEIAGLLFAVACTEPTLKKPTVYILFGTAISFSMIGAFL